MFGNTHSCCCTDDSRCCGDVYAAPGPTSEDPDDQYVEMQAVPPEDNQYEEMQAEPTPPGEIGPAQPEQGWEQAVQSSEPITHEQQMESEPAATSEHLGK